MGLFTALLPGALGLRMNLNTLMVAVTLIDPVGFMLGLFPGLSYLNGI